MLQKLLGSNEKNMVVSFRDLIEALNILVHLCEKVDRAVVTFQTVEAELNRKLKRLDELLQRIEGLSENKVDTDITHKVNALAARGMDAEEISKVLNLSRGEVELILKLWQDEKTT